MLKNFSPLYSPHSDFTGAASGKSNSCSVYLGSTGEKHLDERILELAESIHGVDDECALAEMVITAVRLARGGVSPGDFKMMNRALKEMRVANEVFEPYRDRRKVAVFGSARTSPDNPEYITAMKFAEEMKKHGFMTITGAGPGIMAAGNEGAGRDESFGLNISLPFEAAANEFIAKDPKLIDFNYFFTRKLSFVKEADAAVACPGGVGTMDEIFEAMTLIQTGKATIYPLILLNSKGGNYWKVWDKFIHEGLLANQAISDTDFALWKITDDVDEAVNEILTFYSNFHSYRYVGDRLAIRIKTQPSKQELQKLNEDFSDLIKAGEITTGKALAEEVEHLELPRIVFRHKRRDYGRLRMLIDAINQTKG